MSLRAALWVGLLIVFVILVYQAANVLLDMVLEFLMPGSSTILDDGSLLSYAIQGILFVIDAIGIGGLFLWIRR